MTILLKATNEIQLLQTIEDTKHTNRRCEEALVLSHSGLQGKKLGSSWQPEKLISCKIVVRKKKLIHQNVLEVLSS